MKDKYEVIVIGAGFAGLSCAARLRKRGVTDLAILEKGDEVGAFWSENYDRIRLHTPFHELPDDGGIRRGFGIFMPRDDLISYFRMYAQKHSLYEKLELNTLVQSIARKNDSWEIDTNRGTTCAKYLVVATAYNRKPVRPSISGDTDYRGTLIHSREYKNAIPHVGSRALVIGSGNSAAEIALDLSEGGASSVAMLVRGPRHVISLRGMGIASRIARFLGIELTPKHIAKGHAYTRAHPDFRQKLKEKDAFFLKFSMDLSAHGIRPPENGPATQIALNGRVPWMDQGTVKAIRKGQIRVIDGRENPLTSLTTQGARFGSIEESFDLIVLATGMEPGLEDLFEDPDRYLYTNEDMGRRMPNTDGRSRSVVEPSLFFPGFDLSANGGLSLGLWGFEVADTISDD